MQKLIGRARHKFYIKFTLANAMKKFQRKLVLIIIFKREANCLGIQSRQL